MSWLRWHNARYAPSGRGGAIGWRRGLDLFGRLWGFDRSLVLVNGAPYLDRWVLYVHGYSLRLHKFYRGDDDRAWHSHPWWFITFPLSTYVESVRAGGHWTRREVAPWRPHFRPASFVHYVMYGCRTPFYTIVLTGTKRNDWGFYPRTGMATFVKHRDWK